MTQLTANIGVQYKTKTGEVKTKWVVAGAVLQNEKGLTILLDSKVLLGFVQSNVATTSLEEMNGRNVAITPPTMIHLFEKEDRN
jgi:hypothetical protein